MRPDTLARASLAVVRDGLSPAAAYGMAAALYPRQLALVDDRGTMTFAETSRQITALASALAAAGVSRGDRVGLMCRNHRGFVLTAAALSSVAADVVLLSVEATAPEIEAVSASQRLGLVVHDDEFGTRFPEGQGPRRLVPHREEAEGTTESLDDIEGTSGRRLRIARFPGSHFTLLSSGTTGAPRATARAVPLSVDPLATLVARVPLQVRDVTLIASPLFHAWGFGNLGLAMVFSSTVVLQRRFDPEATLAAVAHHRVRVLAAVPVMLQRLTELPERTCRRYDLSSLEVVAASGSAMPGDLANRFMDRFGDVLYNVYGSTEAGWASIATPSDLRTDPRTAGRPGHASAVTILDPTGRPCPTGEVGRIVVDNALTRVPGTDPPPDVPGGAVATGDLGHFDGSGLLFVDGRQDDMIVSGGENVYPQEVENILSLHPAVLEATVTGVPDDQFGQRLRALVVLREGQSVTEAGVKEFVRARLARYKVPRDVVFVDELPRTASGKQLHRETGDSPGRAEQR
jgi:fatty-acyl-CoA synthase